MILLGGKSSNPTDRPSSVQAWIQFDKYLGRSRFLQNPYIPREKTGSEKYGSQNVIFVKISLHRFELFGSKSLHLRR